MSHLHVSTWFVVFSSLKGRSGVEGKLFDLLNPRFWACDWATTMLRYCTHSSAFSPSVGFKINVWFPVKISKQVGILRAPRDTFTERIWFMSIDASPLLKTNKLFATILNRLNEEVHLHDKWLPLNVKYRVVHRLNSRHFPFFSFSCPSITGCVLFSRKTAFSGWLHLKHKII